MKESDLMAAAKIADDVATDVHRLEKIPGIEVAVTHPDMNGPYNFLAIDGKIANDIFRAGADAYIRQRIEIGRDQLRRLGVTLDA